MVLFGVGVVGRNSEDGWVGLVVIGFGICIGWESGVVLMRTCQVTCGVENAKFISVVTMSSACLDRDAKQSLSARILTYFP